MFWGMDDGGRISDLGGRDVWMSEVYATELLLRSTCNSGSFLGEYLRRKAAFSCETLASCTIFAFFV